MEDFFSINKDCSINGEILRFALEAPEKIAFLCKNGKQLFSKENFDYCLEDYKKNSVNMRRYLAVYKILHNDYNNLIGYKCEITNTGLAEIFESRIIEINAAYKTIPKDLVDMKNISVARAVYTFLNKLLFLFLSLDAVFKFMRDINFEISLLLPSISKRCCPANWYGKVKSIYVG